MAAFDGGRGPPGHEVVTAGCYSEAIMRRLLACGFSLCLILITYRLTGQPDPKVKPGELYKPTAHPDRVILTWSADPATTASVTWRTAPEVNGPLAEIALAEDGAGFVKKATRVNAISEPLKTELHLAHYHSVTFANLQPDTPYVYRVGDGHNWSEWNQFRTAAAGPAPLEFIYLGDAQNDLYSLWSRVIRAGYAEAPRARFILHAGDLINNPNRDDQWGEWHNGAGWINRSIPSVPTPGNHEYGGRVLNSHWRPQFTLPANGIPTLPETNYFLDIQGVRIVSLDSNGKHAEQAAWLDQLLANNPCRWTVLTFHHPVLSTAKGRDNKALREAWQPIIDKHKVDLVLTGHDHTYGRSNLQTGLSTQKGGTIYVVSVSGPKMYELEKQAWMARAAEDTQLFQVIRIDGDVLNYQARTARGVLYDAFELRKAKGKPNRVISRIPATPENRRAPKNKK